MHSGPVEHLRRLERLEQLEHLGILKCSGVEHFRVLDRFGVKIIVFSLNHTGGMVPVKKRKMGQ